MTDTTAPRWYCVSREGLATRCKDEEDARATAAHSDLAWPAGGPHRAVRLVDAEAVQRAAAEARALALEEAALLCEFADGFSVQREHAAKCAAAIRALKATP